MHNQKSVPFMITLPTYVRDQLRAMAAKRNLENLDQVTSAAEIAKDVICESLAKTAISNEIFTNQTKNTQL